MGVVVDDDVFGQVDPESLDHHSPSWGGEILLGAGIQVQGGERQGFIDTSGCMGHQEILEVVVKCILVISRRSLVVR